MLVTILGRDKRGGSLGVVESDEAEERNFAHLFQ